MAEESEELNIKQWEYEVKKLLDGLKGGIKNPEIQDKINDLQSIFKDAATVDQKLDNSDFNNWNVKGNVVIIKDRKDGEQIVEIKNVMSDLIQLIAVLLKRRAKNDVKISDAQIKTIIDGTTDNITALIKERYDDLCKKFESKLNEIISAISKIKTADDEKIISAFKSIFDKSQKIFRALSKRILGQLDTMQALLNEINKNIGEGMGAVSAEVNSLRGEITNLSNSLTTRQKAIGGALQKHSEQLETIIRTLAEINKKIAAIEELLRNLTPDSLNRLLGLISELTSKVNEVNRGVKGIGDLIAERVIPVIERISGEVGDLATKFPEMAGAVNSILVKIDELSKNMRDFPKRDEINQRFDRLEKLIRDIKNALGTRGPVGPGPDEPVYNKKFELMWILVKNEKVANDIKKDEILPKPKDYVLINPGHITVNLNEPDKERLAINHLREVAFELARKKGFDLDQVYICLGAKVVGTEKPWRWDIKHLKNSAPDIHSKIYEAGGSKKAAKEEEREIKELKDMMAHWKREIVDSGPATGILWWHKEGGKNRTLNEFKALYDDLNELIKKHHEYLENPQFKKEVDVAGRILELAIAAYGENPKKPKKENEDINTFRADDKLRKAINSAEFDIKNITHQQLYNTMDQIEKAIEYLNNKKGA